MRFILILTALSLAVPALGAVPGVPIELGDRIASEIRPGSDVDPFSFDGVAGTKLTVTVSGGKGGLAPGLELIGPVGAAVDLARALRRRGTKLSLKGLLLPVTGRYTLLVRSADGTPGAYELKTKGKVPRKLAFEPLVLPAGGTGDLVVFGVGDATLDVRLKAPKGADFRVASVLDPAGEEVPGGAAAFGPGGTERRAGIPLIGGFGEYVIRLAGAGDDVTVRAKVKVRLPRPGKARITLGDEPRPTAVDPAAGPAGGRVSVTGSGFAEGAAVFVGAAEARLPVRVSPEEVTAEVPGGLPVGVAVPIRVLNPDGQSNGIDAAFTVLVPPGVLAVAPPLAAPGDTVSVYGSAFPEGAEVRFGAVPAAATTFVNGGLLLAEIPAGLPEGPADVAVTTPEGLSGRKTAALAVEAAPIVSGVDPAEARPGETVRILGDGFRPGSAVRFGESAAAAVTVESTSAILARIPTSGLAAGAVDVTVVKPFGSEATLAGALTLLEGPAYLGLLITGVIDGPRPGGTPKAIELYATADIDDLADWSLDVATNGGSWSGSPYVLSGSVKAGEFLHVASEEAGFAAYFGFAPEFTSSLLVVNGNDALALFEGATLRDVYGDPADVTGASDHSAAWDHMDGFACRKDGTGPATTFDEQEWTISGPDALDPQGSDGENGDAGVTVPFGEYEE